jgi:Mg2+ and Co2+ transporter CorA
MPELHWKYGYVLWWLLVLCFVSTLIFVFHTYRLLPGSGGLH